MEVTLTKLLKQDKFATRLLTSAWPEFTVSARVALQNLIAENDVVDQLVEGLRKSGIKILDN